MFKFCVVVMAIFALVNTQVEYFNFAKVSEMMPKGVLKCHLNDSIVTQKGSSTPCAVLCKNTPQCLLYCIKGNVCSLFSATVTQRWQGVITDTAIVYDKCYTKYFPGGLVQYLSDPIVSKERSLFPGINSINGFYCPGTPEDSCFKSGGGGVGINVTWEAEFDVIRPVSSIIINTGTFRFLRELKVTFGTDSQYNNPLFGIHPITQVDGIVNITSEIPVAGRYLQIYAYNAPRARAYFSICDLTLA